MAEPEMKHPSRPGFHGTPLGAEALERMALVADAIVPPAAGWPRAGELVPRFVSARVGPEEREELEALLAELTAGGGGEELVERLRGLERTDAEAFAGLRAWVYYGYYGNGAVIDVLEAGNGYHGAPQPLGYRIEREPRLPAEPRGSYRGTEEVVDVLR